MVEGTYTLREWAANTTEGDQARLDPEFVKWRQRRFNGSLPPPLPDAVAPLTMPKRPKPGPREKPVGVARGYPYGGSAPCEPGCACGRHNPGPRRGVYSMTSAAIRKRKSRDRQRAVEAD